MPTCFVCACEILQTEFKPKLLFHLQAQYESTMPYSCRESKDDAETLTRSIASKKRKSAQTISHFEGFI